MTVLLGALIVAGFAFFGASAWLRTSAVRADRGGDVDRGLRLRSVAFRLRLALVAVVVVVLALAVAVGTR